MEWLRSQKRSSMRWLQWFILLAVGLLVSVFLSTVVTSGQALAADAKWDSSKISYDNETFERVSDVDKLKALNLGSDQVVYMSKKTVANNQDVRVIHFPSTGDLGSMTSVSLTTFTYTAPNTYTKKESTTLSIDPPSQNSASSCEVAGGIGWILCPVSAWLASSIDWMFGVLKSFLVVPPLQTGNQTSGIFLAWNIVRNIANGIFIIMFIVIIYSQVTSMGISNYGIKKMLPRLIVAAVLVNLSFHVCAILLDLSNIAGSALQDMFMNIRNTVATLGGSAPASEPMTWQEVTFQILGGAAGGAALAAGIVMRAELLPFIVPLLCGIGLVILLVVIIMAARQALIVILIIISPLAFVAYLLPGTEKWFDKWKDVFLTMLIFFPGFAAAFGGAQLAGSVIMQNAAGPNGAVMYILGMAVQIAPLALTPLMIRLGGGLLGKFTGLVNDRSKGLFDRSKNWAKEQSEITKHKKLNKRPDSKFTPTAWRRRLAQSSQNRKDRLKELQDQSDVIRKGTDSYAKIDQFRRSVGEDKNIVEGKLQSAWNAHQSTNQAAIIQDFQSRSIRQMVDAEKQVLDNRFTALQTGHGELPENVADNTAVQEAIQRARDSHQTLAVQGLRKSGIDRVLNDQFARAMRDDDTGAALRSAAGGIEDAYYASIPGMSDDLGSRRAAAAAAQTVSAAYEESVKNATAILNGSNVSDADTVSLIGGNAVGNIPATDDIRNAAGRKIASSRGAKPLLDMLSKVQMNNLTDDLAQELGVALKNNSARPWWLGGSECVDIQANAIKDTGDAFKVRNMIKAFEKGKLSADKALASDAVFLEDTLDMMQKYNIAAQLTPEAKKKLNKSITTILTHRNYAGRYSGEQEDALKGIQNLL